MTTIEHIGAKSGKHVW